MIIRQSFKRRLKMPQSEAMQRLEEIILQINEADAPSEDLFLKLQEFRPVDVADVFDHVKRTYRTPLFNSFSDEMAAEVLVELDDIFAIEVLRDLPTEKTALLLNYLPPDEGADVIALSEEEDQPEILTHVEDDLAEQIRDLATYAPESAGGLMTSHFVSVTGKENVRSVLLTVKTSDEAETINYIYVVNGENRITGVITVRDLLQADLSETISAIMEKDVITVPLEMDQEEVTRISNKYHLHCLPVVDDRQVLKGIITFDDIMEVLEDESSEDMYKMAGEVTDHPTQQPVLRRVLARFPWLLLTLGGTLLVAVMIKAVEAAFTESDQGTGLDNLLISIFSIQSNWTFLICFLPMIMGMAGNVGIQSSTVMVRGLATGEVEQSFFLKILSKEILISWVIGLISGLMIGGLLYFMYPDNNRMGFVVGISLFAAVFAAAVLGTLLPFMCLLVKVDPAYASGPVLTTMNDIFGFLIYFGIAYLML
jgi:magnesium transporter